MNYVEYDGVNIVRNYTLDVRKRKIDYTKETWFDVLEKLRDQCYGMYKIKPVEVVCTTEQAFQIRAELGIKDIKNWSRRASILGMTITEIKESS